MRANVRSPLLALFVVALAARSGSIAHAGEEPSDAGRVHYQKGAALFDAGDFKGAIAEFAAADSVAPSPVLEFNIALCYDRLGDKPEALRRYRAYLDKQPNAANRAAVEGKIKTLADAVAAEEAQRQADEAKRHAAEAGADKPIPPPLTGESPGTSGAAGVTAPAGAPPTGDPELDRVNAIDVRQVRDQRLGTGGAAGAAPAGGALTQGGPQAAGGPAYGPAPAGQPGPAAPPPSDEPKAKPVYKQWWFWVVVGVSAVILIDIASSDSSSANTPRGMALVLDPSSQRELGGGDGGATLLHF